MNINLNNPSRLVRSLGRILWLVGALPLLCVSGAIISTLGVVAAVAILVEWLIGSASMRLSDCIGEALINSVSYLWERWNILKFS